jgi:DNA-binding SARP family transcriptional activator
MLSCSCLRQLVLVRLNDSGLAEGCRISRSASLAILRSEHPLTAQIQSNLAQLYQSMGDYSKAENLFRQVLSTQEEVLAIKSPEHCFDA